HLLLRGESRRRRHPFELSRRIALRKIRNYVWRQGLPSPAIVLPVVCDTVNGEAFRQTAVPKRISIKWIWEHRRQKPRYQFVQLLRQAAIRVSKSFYGESCAGEPSVRSSSSVVKSEIPPRMEQWVTKIVLIP